MNHSNVISEKAEVLLLFIVEVRDNFSEYKSIKVAFGVKGDRLVGRFALKTLPCKSINISTPMELYLRKVCFLPFTNITLCIQIIFNVDSTSHKIAANAKTYPLVYIHTTTDFSVYPN